VDSTAQDSPEPHATVTAGDGELLGEASSRVV
jgi:hypothetical protein